MRKSKYTVWKGKKPIKSKAIMHVGGRKISAAIQQKDNYDFPIIVTYKSESEQK